MSPPPISTPLTCRDTQPHWLGACPRQPPGRVMVSNRKHTLCSVVRGCARIPPDRRRAPCPSSSSRATRSAGQPAHLLPAGHGARTTTGNLWAGSIQFSPRHQGRSAPSTSWKPVISTATWPVYPSNKGPPYVVQGGLACYPPCWAGRRRALVPDSTPRGDDVKADLARRG